MPDIAALEERKALMREAGLRGALLTGSGSGIFGIADSPAAAEQAAAFLKEKAPAEDEIIVCSGMIG